jgi:transposase
LSYLAFKGELGPGQQVEHSCDVRACVAPHHLRAGTAKSNNEDKARKGRAAKKLTAEQVVEIRARCAAGEFQYVVARDYGVTQRAVWNVVHRLHWGHVP